MASLSLWILHAKALVIFFIFRQAWSLSVDLMVKVASSGECLQPVVCKQDPVGQIWGLSVTIVPDDLFSLGRSVQSVEGDIVLVSSLSEIKPNSSRIQHGDTENFDLCSLSCSTFFSERRDVYLQKAYLLSNILKPSLFDNLNPESMQLDSIIHSINSLLSRDKWSTHILLTSSYAAVTAISSGIKSPESKFISFIMDNDSQLNDTLKSLYDKLQKKDLNFIVVCSVQCIVDVLNQDYQFETMVSQASNKWLLIPTTGYIEDIVKSNMQIPGADIVVLEQTPYRNIYPVLRLGELRKLLSILGTYDVSKTYKGVTDYINQSGPSVSSNVYMLYTVQKEKKIRRVGHISEDGDVVVSEDLFTGFKYGFKNRTLTVSTLEWPPFVMKKEENDSITYSGMCIDLLQELSRSLNFSYHIVEPDDQEWGREIDGRWTGLVGEMVYKKADLAVSAFTVMEPRERVMDFTVPFFYVQSAIIIKKPDSNTNKWKTLVAPFRFEVHICIIFSLFFSALFLFIVEEIHPVNTLTDNRVSARWTRYGDILWYHFGALMANGGAYLPFSGAGLSVLSCWWFFTVICAAVYSGNLIAFLTDFREDPPFMTLEEMVEQDSYKWGTLGGTAHTDLFQNSNQSIYKKVWRGMQSDSEQTSLDREVHLRRVLEGQYAYVGDETMGKLWKTNQCDLHVFYESIFTMGYSIGLPNNSAYTKIFSEQILRINELGLPRMWHEKWSSDIECGTSRSVKRVDLLALQSAFYAAGVGVLLSLFVLIAEVVYRRHCRHCTLSTENCEGESETRL